MELQPSSTIADMDDESILRNRKIREKPPLWDSFQDPPSKRPTGSGTTWTKLSLLLQLFKVFTYIFVFITVLTTGVASKVTYALMVAQVSKGLQIKYCHIVQANSTMWVQISNDEQIAWLWGIIFAFAAPEVFTFFRALRICTFKDVKSLSMLEVVSVVLSDLFHVIGLAVFTFKVCSYLDSGKALMLCNGVCFIPALLNIFNASNIERRSLPSFSISILALIVQASAFVVWPANTDFMGVRVMAIPLTLISARWWENFFNSYNCVAFDKERTRSMYRTYLYLAPLKVIVFSLLAFVLDGRGLSVYFTEFGNAWRTHNIIVKKNSSSISDSLAELPMESFRIKSSCNALMYTLLLQITSSYLCYVFAKFACKIKIQHFSFSLPLILVGPVSVVTTFLLASLRESNACIFHGFISDHVAFKSISFIDLPGAVIKEYLWIWIFWWLSQVWITLHIWHPRNDKNSPTEKLFVFPWYCGLLVDQCILMNRRIVNCNISMKTAPGFIFSENASNIRISESDVIPQVIVCATMWHETQEEMMEFLKSIIRLDEDQCARRMAKMHINGGKVDDEYYELETNIFFDDAFILDEMLCENQKNPPLNKYVKILITSIEKAVFEVYGVSMTIKPPVKIETLYGGRLVWILPGRSKMVAHLKNKDKIRHKKRWSQVMYMYYLLGFRIMELENVSVRSKALIAENTFLLALDGDIDFQPQAVQLLIDRMKAVDELGAACGRIHPVGRGPMVWYQIFEYAIGHWLQKATEHVIGCVLCSPGCFSLFRGSALMENSVMKKYTTVSQEPLHYVQYDQGEDRWLCTLLLKQGLRVEYSAASDAYTHSPEVFNEFYNQRRRWIPSTIANIFDLLSDAEMVVKNNSSISKPYVAYQGMLMVGTILGPGTIFLMMMGALVTVFGIGIWPAFLWNLLPVIFFMLSCIYLKQNCQLLLAFIISSVYCLVMLAVLIGIIIQIIDDGPLAPASLFFLLVFSQIFIAGVLHPQEMSALICGFIYYITIPSMYMLLLIYSVFNMNDVSWGTREVESVKVLQNNLPLRDVERKKEYLPGWMNDPHLMESELGEITLREKRFWKDLISLYLKPLYHTKEKKAEIAEGLMDLRNIFAFAFFMINAIFVLIVFLLQLKKEYLHLEWPIDPVDFITYDDLNSQIYIYRQYKELDPIGLCFVLFFGFILIIQFIAMFFHRFATIAQLLATTQLNWFPSTTAVTDEDAAKEIRGNAVNIARQLQRPMHFHDDVAVDAKDNNKIGSETDDRLVRRQTIVKLLKNRSKQQYNYSDLPTNFERRFLSDDVIKIKNISMSRKSFMLLDEARVDAKRRLTKQVCNNANFSTIAMNEYENPSFEC